MFYKESSKKMENATKFIQSKLKDGFVPKIGLVLGSGLGDIANDIDGISISYEEIPGFNASTVQGHAGKLVLGSLCSKNVVAMQGRFHFYEGYSLDTVTFPIRVMKKLGVEILVVTNASGGVNVNFNPGDLMLINDHLNLVGQNPLFGKNIDELGPRFVDMTYAYNRNLMTLAKETAKKLNINLYSGVYAGLSGPTYETPAEVRMLRTLGADAVGMSTVPEVIVANHMGLQVLGISCITNKAAGILDQPLNHDEVIESSNKSKIKFVNLLKTIIKEIPA